MKILGIVLAVVALIIIIVVAVSFWAVSNLDSLVLQGIEKGGSRLMDTEVSVESVDLSLRQGRCSIAGLSVGNPEGFRGDEAFHLGEVVVQINLASLREQPIRLTELLVKAPEIFLELDEDGNSNLDKLRRRLERFQPGDGAVQDEEPSGDGDAEIPESKLFAVTSFIFEEGKIHADATAMGGESYDLDLPAIELKNIGGKEGVPPEVIGQEALIALSKKAGDAAAKEGLGRVIDEHLSGDAAEKVKDLISGLK